MPSFDDYAKKMKKLGENVPKIFKKVAQKAAVKFVNEAKTRTKNEPLVDTGAYRDHWDAEVIEPVSGTYGVLCINSMDYASHLEQGHKLRNGKRWKGRFIGELSLQSARYYAIRQLDDELDKAFIKYHRSFTE